MGRTPVTVGWSNSVQDELSEALEGSRSEARKADERSMNKRAISFLILATLIVVSVGWAIGQIETLRKDVASHGQRIEKLERAVR